MSVNGTKVGGGFIPQAEEDARIAAILSSGTFADAAAKLKAQGFPANVDALRRWGQRRAFAPQGPDFNLRTKLRMANATIDEIARLMGTTAPNVGNPGVAPLALGQVAKLVTHYYEASTIEIQEPSSQPKEQT